MAIGGDSWCVVVRRTFVEVVPTNNKHVRAKSESNTSFPILPNVVPTSTTAAKKNEQTPSVGLGPSGRESSRSRQPASNDGVMLSKHLSKKGGWCAKLCSAVGRQAPLVEDGGQSFQDIQESFARGMSAHDTKWRVVGAGSRSGLPSTMQHGEVKRRSAPLPVLQAFLLEQQPLAQKEDAQGEEQDNMIFRSPTFSWDDATEEEFDRKNKDDEHRTTVVISDIASTCTREGLLAKLDAVGLSGQYDFVYLPVSFETLETHGYGIVNFVSTQSAQMLMKSSPNSVSFSDQRQGLEGHVANFQDSSLMHEGVPDQFKPVLFKNGQRIAFPAPTRPTRMPRELKRAIWRMKNGELPGDSSPLQVSDVLTPKAHMEQCSSPCSTRLPKERCGGSSVANSRRAHARRGRGSCA